jgi:spermidine synthase
MERLALDLEILVLNASVTLVLLKAYRDRAGFKVLARRLDALLAPSEEKRNWRPNVILFLASFAGLYTEVMMIRWIGTEVRVFAYFQNLALIACFLGFGLGCYWAKRRKSILPSLIATTVLVCLVQFQIWSGPWRGLLDRLTNLLSLSPDATLWGARSADPSLNGAETWLLLGWSSILVLAGLLFLLVVVMIPLGQWVGSCLDEADDPISAYSVNLVGSVIGIWAYAGLAFLWMPPGYWFLLLFVLLLLLGARSARLMVIGLLLLGLCSALFQLRRTETQTHWSPYQKIDVLDKGEHEYEIHVNNTGYMSIANLTPGFERRHSEYAGMYPDHSSYDLPFRFALRRDHVLIVGAGAGNDAAAALRNGAGEVTTVEIDPLIYSLGEKLHPEQPYASPRVHKIQNDARAFLRQASQKYDVVLFGLLDSHTEFSEFSNMRIDNYVYTEESFREARRLLSPGGVLVVKFGVRTPWEWMGQRLYKMLDEVFGRPPVVLDVPQLGPLLFATVLVTSNDAGLWTRVSQPNIARLLTENPPGYPLRVENPPSPTTDDWPYFYHRTHSIPRTYLVVSLILLAMSLALVRGSFAPRQPATWIFFFLGAGFLLLETQLVSRLALYFGTTWLVNCVALTAVLLMLVLANLFVAYVRPKGLTPYYVLLLISLLVNYLVPWERLPLGARTVGMLVSAAYGVCVFFAGVIFTTVFALAERKSDAFGANIIGAVAGGLAQNISFVVGMKALLLIAALFYVVAALCASFRPQELRVRHPSYGALP